VFAHGHRAQAVIQRLHDQALVGAERSRVGIPPSLKLRHDKSAFAGPSAFVKTTVDKTAEELKKFLEAHSPSGKSVGSVGSD